MQNNIKPAVAALVILTLCYAVDRVVQTSNMLKVVSFHEIERLSEKLDLYLNDPTSSRQELSVVKNSQSGRLEAKGANAASVPAQLLTKIRPDRDTQWLRANGKVWHGNHAWYDLSFEIFG